MDKVPQRQAKKGNLNSRGCAIKTQPFCGQHKGQLHAARRFWRAQRQVFPCPCAEGALPCSVPACRQMDGLELSAPTDLSGAHGKLLSLEGK